MFWIISAILIIIAIAFILPTLLRKEFSEDATREQNLAIAKEQLDDLEQRFNNKDIDEKSYKLIKEELENALFIDLKESGPDGADKANSNNNKQTTGSISTWLILLLVPVIAIPVYLNLGNLDFTKEFDSKQAVIGKAMSTMPLKADGTPDIEKVTENLKLEMESNPTDPRGWFMLGRAYMTIQRFPEAVDSFEKSLALRPGVPDTMLQLADALSMNNEGRLEGKPRELVKKTLAIEPQNLMALWLSGMAASQEGEYAEAITQWEKVLPLIENKPKEKSTVVGLIVEAKSRLSSEVPKQVTKQATNEVKSKPVEKIVDTENQNLGIKVVVSLADSLKEKASPNDSVFIYAKAISGPPIPLAAVRKQVKDFPLELVLNDESAMMPSLKLSSFKRVTVGARISKTSQAIATQGDLFVEKTDVSLGDNISLEINQIYKK